MSGNSILVVGAIVALLAVGCVAGYALSQNDPVDNSDGMSDSEINQKLQSYADGLNQYGGKIYTNGNGLSISAGSSVTVNNGDLVFIYNGGTYYVPYHGISYILINHA